MHSVALCLWIYTFFTLACFGIEYTARINDHSKIRHYTNVFADPPWTWGFRSSDIHRNIKLPARSLSAVSWNMILHKQTGGWYVTSEHNVDWPSEAQSSRRTCSDTGQAAIVSVGCKTYILYICVLDSPETLWWRESHVQSEAFSKHCDMRGKNRATTAGNSDVTGIIHKCQRP